MVRYGIRKAGDALIEDSLRVVDAAACKADFPAGPCWRRYNHDGYGQRDDGGAFRMGRGRPWPLLTGERGPLRTRRRARRAISIFARSKAFATPTRLLPEQIWDRPDNPQAMMVTGKPTGAAMPLMWAHAEYIKLLRSVSDGQVFDLIPEVAERYRRVRQRVPLEIWKWNRKISAIAAGSTLRIQATAPFTLHWSKDEWHTVHDTPRSRLRLVSTSPISTSRWRIAPVRFTFLWLEDNHWEGRDFAVAVTPRQAV